MGANPKTFVLIGLLLGGLVLALIGVSTQGWVEGKNDSAEMTIGLSKGCVTVFGQKTWYAVAYACSFFLGRSE